MFKFSTTTLLGGLKGAIADYKHYDSDTVARIVDGTSAADPFVTIHRLGKFSKSAITKIYKREGNAGTAGKAEITCTTSTVPSKGTTTTAAGVYRLKLYVKLSGNNDANYSNVWVFKGKPYVYEFEVKESAKAATDVAAAAEAAINRLASRFNDKVFNIVRDGAKLTITTVGADAVYHSITECVLQKYDCTLNTPLVGGEYVDVVECSVTDNTNKLTLCVNPFGTYGQLIKDLRLPTPEHTGWSVIQKDEMPELNVIYDQYIIYMCKNRGIMGGDAVGEPTKSITAHALWVPQGTGSTNLANLLGSLATVEAYNAEYSALKTAVASASTSAAIATALNAEDPVTIEPDLAVFPEAEAAGDGD